MQINTCQISPGEFTRSVQAGMIPLFNYAGDHAGTHPFAIPPRVLKNWRESKVSIRRGDMTQEFADYHLEEGVLANLATTHSTRPYLLLGLQETASEITLCHDIQEVLPAAKRAFERILARI